MEYIIKNKYLNLEVDDMEITNIINGLKKQLKPSMDMDEFKKVMTELRNISHSELSEYDEELIADIFDSLSKKFNKHIEYYLKDKTLLNTNDLPIKETFGDFMYFLNTINY